MILDLVSTLRERWANGLPLFRFIILAGLATAIGLVGLKPAYRGFKTWRQERNLVAARAAIGKQKMAAARDLSLTVLRAGASGIEALRILEKSTAALNDPLHAQVSRTLMTHPDGTDEDRLKAFRAIAMELPLGAVAQAWSVLSKERQRQSGFASGFAARLIAEHRLDEAAAVLLAVPEGQRDTAVNQGLLRTLIRSGQRDATDEVQRLLAMGMAMAPDAELSGWLDLLEEMPALSLREDLLQPVRRVLAAPACAGEARQALALARLDYAANFAKRGQVIAAAVARWKDRDPAALGRFLLNLGLNQVLLDTLPVERIGGHPELFPMVLEATEATGAWAQVAPLLDAHGRLLPRFEELGRRAVAAAKAGDTTVGASDWATVMSEAKSGAASGALMKLSLLARKAGFQDESEKAMVEAIRLGCGPLPLYEDLKPLLASLERQGRESTLLEIHAVYLSCEPGNPEPLTQYSYLSCLNDLLEPKAVLKAMKTVAAAHPDEVPIQCVLATICLCDGQYQQAAETLDRLQLDAGKLAPRQRIALLATQLLNKRITKDDPKLLEFRWDDLQQSERSKFSKLIRAALLLD